MDRQVSASRLRRRHILFSVNTSWNVVNFRSGLIRSLLAQGYAITVAAPRDDHSAAIEALGCRFVALPMQRDGRSPFADVRLLFDFVRLFLREKPMVFLGYTAKPNIYGSIAAALTGVPAINNIAGLGRVFGERGLTHRILRALYRLALRRSTRVFFQNRDDLAMFVDTGLVTHGRVALLPGSGVDLARFSPAAPAERSGPIFLLVARLLWTKGIAETVAAARQLRSRHPDATIKLLGFVEDGNPAFVSHADLQGWQRDGDIVYLGAANDVRPHLAAADCVLLPSYYPEGTPRSLLEAAAMGKPIVTCDMPGCRDVVVEGQNGFLVPPRDAAALATAMIRFCRLTPAQRAAMGRRSRQLAEERFDERIIHDSYAAALGDLPQAASWQPALAR